MASNNQSTWTAVWGKTQNTSNQNQTQTQLEARRMSTSEEALTRITSASQRRYADYLAHSFNLDPSVLQPTG